MVDAVTIFGRLFAAIAAIVLLYILYIVLKQAWAHHRPLQQSAGSSSSITFSTPTWKWMKSRRQGHGGPEYTPLEEEEDDSNEQEDARSYRDSNSVNATPVAVQGPWSDDEAWNSSARLSLSKPLPERPDGGKPLPDKPLPPVPGSSKGNG